VIAAADTTWTAPRDSTRDGARPRHRARAWRRDAPRVHRWRGAPGDRAVPASRWPGSFDICLAVEQETSRIGDQAAHALRLQPA